MLEQNVKQDYNSKIEQVDASVRFVLMENPDFYESLGNLPSRVQAALLTIIGDWVEPSGYHFHVLRAAYRQFHRESGLITVDEVPFTHDELYR